MPEAAGGDPRAAEATARVASALRSAGSVFAEEEAGLLASAAESGGDLEAMLGRRLAGVPLEHVLGWVHFRGARHDVDPGVFVPRRRTELVVGVAAKLTPPGSVIVDLCCGSGAIGAALADEVEGAQVFAVDVDASAVANARRNLTPPGGEVLHGDLYDPLPDRLRGLVDLVVACAPYVPTGAISLMPPEARLHEPTVALDGGRDGLDVVRRVVSGAPDWLASRGHVLVEVGEDQVGAVVDAFAAVGMGARVVRDPGLGATVVLAGP